MPKSGDYARPYNRTQKREVEENKKRVARADRAAAAAGSNNVGIMRGNPADFESKGARDNARRGAADYHERNTPAKKKKK